MSRTIFVNIPKENLFAYSSNKISVKEEIKPIKKDKFTVGKRYALKGDECEGFGMYTNVYELVKKYDTLNGVDFSSVIMKPIDVNSTTVFTLTKQDCANLGIQFEEGLQIFPKDLNWMPIDEEKVVEIDLNREYNENDMSTYPVDKITRTVNHIVLRLTGFTQLTPTLMKTFSGRTISISSFVRSLLITYENGVKPFPTDENLYIRGRIITNSLVPHLPKDAIVDNSTHSIFIEIDTIFKDLSNDKVYGIQPEFLVGKNIDELINVSWEETYGLDVYRNTRSQQFQPYAATTSERLINDLVRNVYKF